MPVETVFHAVDLTRVYRVGEVDVHALRGVSFDIDGGEFVVMLGPSGSGKSTLLNILGGLDVPTTGTVRWRDHDLSHADEKVLTRYRREHVGFVFQFCNLIPSLTARENVQLVTDIVPAPLPPAEARSRARETLVRVGLGHRLDRRPPELSGGEQQRVAIARALAGRPRLVWADEPTGNLDSEMAASVMELLSELHAEGLTLVLVTHDPNVAARADRLITVRDGRIVADELLGAEAPLRREPEPAGALR